jgi:hypothetical protein
MVSWDTNLTWERVYDAGSTKATKEGNQGIFFADIPVAPKKKQGSHWQWPCFIFVAKASVGQTGPAGLIFSRTDFLPE